METFLKILEAVGVFLGGLAAIIAAISEATKTKRRREKKRKK